jgi:hypothetical protein
MLCRFWSEKLVCSFWVSAGATGLTVTAPYPPRHPNHDCLGAGWGGGGGTVYQKNTNTDTKDNRGCHHRGWDGGHGEGREIINMNLFTNRKVLLFEQYFDLTPDGGARTFLPIF